MSSEFYFQKWKKTLAWLEDIVNMDIDYQKSRAHDKDCCDATLRLTSVLGQYMTVYNHIMECRSQNLQVQKTEYIEEAVKAIVDRMLELRKELIHLDESEHQFINNGLIHQKLTTFDAELTELPNKEERSRQIQIMIEGVIEKVNERKMKIEEQKRIEEQMENEEAAEKLNWWDEECNIEAEEDKFYNDVEKKVELTEEQKEIKMNIERIQAHEKTRQVIAWRIRNVQKRERWQKEIEGTCAPQAPYEIRQRSAALIQKVLREYFKCKRQKYVECKRDELLGLKLCLKPKKDAQEKIEQIKAETPKLKQKYEEKWKTDFELIKEKYRKRKGDEICESYRDHIRDWFRIWFEEIKLFYDIPDEKAGGSTLILKEEVPTPEEYLEEYKAYMANKKSNKNQSAVQRKLEKLEAKRQAAIEKREAIQKKKMEKELKRKLMKDPTKHPGFDFPESKKTEYLLKVIQDYHNDWDEYDSTDILDVKEGHFNEIERIKAFKEVKMEVIPQADEIMRIELKQLKIALKKDYKANEEEMPEPMKKKRKRQKKNKHKHAAKHVMSENLAEKFEELVFRGFIKEYPKTKLEDFIGDPNFVGDDIRCGYELALPLHGETRRMWWERCREMIHGFNKILLVGPRGGGKTTLIHAIASMNDAMLFELDPNQIRSEFAFDVYLDRVVQYVVACAKAAQPTVIHIKHVHRFYYKKVPKEDAEVELELFKRHFTKKLFKKINKLDKITVIGSCVDPWLTKSKQMLKQFPNVVLLPNTNYSTIVQLLNEWVLSNHVVPADFSVSCLAQVLQGYSFGYLKQFLEGFLTAERIRGISSNGISPLDVYNVLLDENVEKVDYAKYLQWYSKRTAWGKRERLHHEEQKEFKQALERWALKKEMEKRRAKNLDNK